MPDAVLLEGLYLDCCSPWTVVHHGQLTKRSMIFVSEELFPHFPYHFGGFENSILNHIEVIAFIAFSALQRGTCVKSWPTR